MYEMTAEVRINVRTNAKIKRDLEITARLRGLTVSSLVNALVVKAIREEKALEPSAFEPSRSVTLRPKGEKPYTLDLGSTEEAPSNGGDLKKGIRVVGKGSKMPAAKTPIHEQPQKKQRRA